MQTVDGVARPAGWRKPISTDRPAAANRAAIPRPSCPVPPIMPICIGRKYDRDPGSLSRPVQQAGLRASGLLINEPANVSNGCIARGAAARRVGAAARGVRRRAATAGNRGDRSMGRLGRTGFSLLLVRRRRSGARPGTRRQSQPARAGAQSRLRLLGGVRYRFAATGRNLERSGALRPPPWRPGSPSSRSTPAARRRTPSLLAACGSPTASIRAGSSESSRPSPIHANRRQPSRKWGVVRFRRAWAGSRQSSCCREASASSIGRSHGGQRVDNRARRHNRRRTASDGHAPFQDCRIRRAAGCRARQQGRRDRYRAVAGYTARGRRDSRAVLTPTAKNVQRSGVSRSLPADLSAGLPAGASAKAGALAKAEAGSHA